MTSPRRGQARGSSRMHPSPIVWPMGALALFTLTVLLIVPFRRFAAARAGKVTAKDFAYGESRRVPGEVSIPNRNYMNLLEAPVLFYVVGALFLVEGRAGKWVLAAAWVYVALRVTHSAIHLTYNNVFHRLTAFAVSNGVLAALWIMFLWGV